MDLSILTIKFLQFENDSILYFKLAFCDAGL